MAAPFDLWERVSGPAVQMSAAAAWHDKANGVRRGAVSIDWFFSTTGRSVFKTCGEAWRLAEELPGDEAPLGACPACRERTCELAVQTSAAGSYDIVRCRLQTGAGIIDWSA